MSESMKTITYHGNQYEVPYWVKWADTDLANGSITFHENKPYVRHFFRDFYSEGRTLSITGDGKSHFDWMKSLEPV